MQFKSFVNTAFEPTMYSPHRAMFAVQGPTRWDVVFIDWIFTYLFLRWPPEGAGRWMGRHCRSFQSGAPAWTGARGQSSRGFILALSSRCPHGRSHLVSEDEQPIPSERNQEGVHGIAAIYHYVTKSKQDFDDKIRRGGGAGVTRPLDYMLRLDQACNETCYEAALQYARLCGAGQRRMALGGGSGGRRVY